MQRISYVMDGIMSRMDLIATGDYVCYIFYTRAVCVIWMSASRASQRLFHAPTIAKSTGVLYCKPNWAMEQPNFTSTWSILR